MELGYEQRAKWALQELAEKLESILDDFDALEQESIRIAIANYTIGYLGVQLKVGY